MQRHVISVLIKAVGAVGLEIRIVSITSRTFRKGFREMISPSVIPERQVWSRPLLVSVWFPGPAASASQRLGLHFRSAH